ncbi:MAG: hypothetical protein RLZZ413_1173 [Pseudomonadota bacterium]
MIGASKILTVSYGTFSCTLEGFDEPFNTMKAIAEYFRDLAADDRYFGAEPPTPDAAMLHKIAERAVNRRVEARIEDNAVILRTSDAMQAPPASPAGPVTSALRSTPPQPAPQPPFTGLLAEESVAAKLQRIRAAVARNAKQAEAAPYVDEEDSAPVFAAPVAFSAEPPAGQPEATLPLPQGDRGRADDAARPADFAGAPDRPAEPAGTDNDRDEPLALLPEAAAADRPEPVETAVDTGTTGRAGDGLALSLRLQAEQEDELPEALPEVTQEDLPDAAQADDDALLALTGVVPPHQDGAWNESAAAQPVPAPVPARDVWAQEDGSDPETLEVWDATSFPAAKTDDDEAFEDLSEPTGSDSAWPVDPELPEPFDGEAEPAAAADKLRRARERVLVARAPVASTDGAGPVPDGLLSAQAEGEDEDEDEDDADATQKAEGRTILEYTANEAEDVTRLLRQTNTEMDEPENRRRLSTMAHLKAAVAATVADLRSAGGGSRTGEATRLDRYRADLARVVRPRRPGGSAPAERPAPLVLVSEQRIDRPAPEGANNRVVPRRISTTNLAVEETPEDIHAPAEADAIFAASRNFSEFAEHLGASDMPDLLEAAAAYTACVEGRPYFSRPHLMRHVAAASGQTELNREDSMRSFGTLLRQGKIAKVKRGQFAITDSSYYLAEARRMTR